MQRTTLRVVKDEVVSREAMIVAQHPLIAEAGAELLQDGGNAMDAAVAAAFAAGVVEPFMSGLGGGGALIVHQPASGRSTTIEFSLRVPALAGEHPFELDPDAPAQGLFAWPAVKHQANRIGWQSALVPGAVAGLALALERFGTRPLREVLAPAIRYAREGVRTDWYLTLNIACAEPELAAFPSTAAVFLPGGHPPRARLGFGEPTDLFVQPDLAATLEAIAAEGPRTFYQGDVAQALDRAMREHGGFLRREDLQRYRPVVYEQPLECRYRGRYTVHAIPGPMAGTTLVELLQILDGFDLAALGHNRPATLHLLAETMRRAYVDRSAFMADPDFVHVPLAGLTSPAFAAARRQTIDPHRADLEPTPGDPWPFDPAPRARGAGQVARPIDASCTTHLSVVDRDRMMVSLTNTLLELWGSRVVIPGTGVLLNDGMFWFDPRPGAINRVQPGCRPLSNMTPLVVLRDGRPWLAIGAPGGRKLITGILQSLLNLVDFGLSVADAVAAPRIHSEDAITYADSRLPAETLEALRGFGQQVQPLEETYAASNFGRVVAILVDEAAGLLRGGVHVWQPATAIGL